VLASRTASKPGFRKKTWLLRGIGLCVLVGAIRACWHPAAVCLLGCLKLYLAAWLTLDVGVCVALTLTRLICRPQVGNLQWGSISSAQVQRTCHLCHSVTSICSFTAVVADPLHCLLLCVCQVPSSPPPSHWAARTTYTKSCAGSTKTQPQAWSSLGCCTSGSPLCSYLPPCWLRVLGRCTASCWLYPSCGSLQS
jgi:hypothetical protein